MTCEKLGQSGMCMLHGNYCDHNSIKYECSTYQYFLKLEQDKRDTEPHFHDYQFEGGIEIKLLDGNNH